MFETLVDKLNNTLSNNFQDWKQEQYPFDRTAIISDMLSTFDCYVLRIYLEEIHCIDYKDIIKINNIKSDYLNSGFYDYINQKAMAYVNNGKSAFDFIHDEWVNIDVELLIRRLHDQNIDKVEICLCAILCSLADTIFSIHYLNIIKYRQVNEPVLILNDLEEYDQGKYLWPVLR